MSDENLNPEGRMALKKEILNRLMEIYEKNLKDIHRLTEEYEDDKKNLEDEDLRYSREREDVNSEVRDYLGMKKAEHRNEEVHDDLEEKREKYLKKLLKDDEYHKFYLEMVLDLNSKLNGEIDTLINHVTRLKDAIESIRGIKKARDFIDQASIIVDLKRKVVRADSDILKLKENQIFKKRRIQQILGQILDEKRKLLNVEFHDLKEGEEQIEDYKEEMQDIAA